MSFEKFYFADMDISRRKDDVDFYVWKFRATSQPTEKPMVLDKRLSVTDVLKRE